MSRQRQTPCGDSAWSIPDEIAPDLEVVDAALMRLRRLWTAPRTHEGMRADLGDDVELSTVLVVDALVRDTHDDVSPRGVAEVAEQIDVAASTASRLVDRAVAAGMVERRTSPVDARRAALHLTDAGRALHVRARRFRAGYLARVLVDWSPREIAQLADRLDAFADAVSDAESDISDSPPSPRE